ncbi:hypothetical protein D3C72_1643970 [compost metagenome]
MPRLAIANTVAVLLARKIERIGQWRTANCTPVAVRNMAQAMPPAIMGLRTSSSRDSSDGPSANTNEVAVIPGPKVAMPQAKCRRLATGTVGSRRRNGSPPDRAGRHKGSKQATASALPRTASSVANTDRIGCARVCAKPPASSGPSPAPNTIDTEASNAAWRLRSLPPRSPTAAMPADTMTPTAMPVSSRAMPKASTDCAPANSRQAVSAASRPGSRIGLRP